MDFAVRVLARSRRHFQETLKRPLHCNATRKLVSIVRFVQRHPVSFTLLGVIVVNVLLPVVIISPLLFVLCSLMVFLGGIFIVSFSFLSGFLLSFLLLAFSIAATCYLLYCVVQESVCRLPKLFIFLASCPSRIRNCLTSALYELCSQLLDGISSDLGQLFNKRNEATTDAKRFSGSDSSEVEDIEPDYRDTESKLYDALVSRQFIEGDTFKPFPY